MVHSDDDLWKSEPPGFRGPTALLTAHNRQLASAAPSQLYGRWTFSEPPTFDDLLGSLATASLHVDYGGDEVLESALASLPRDAGVEDPRSVPGGHGYLAIAGYASGTTVALSFGKSWHPDERVFQLCQLWFAASLSESTRAQFTSLATSLPRERGYSAVVTGLELPRDTPSPQWRTVGEVLTEAGLVDSASATAENPIVARVDVVVSENVVQQMVASLDPPSRRPTADEVKTILHYAHAGSVKYEATSAFGRSGNVVFPGVPNDTSETFAYLIRRDKTVILGPPVLRRLESNGTLIAAASHGALKAAAARLAAEIL